MRTPALGVVHARVQLHLLLAQAGRFSHCAHLLQKLPVHVHHQHILAHLHITPAAVVRDYYPKGVGFSPLIGPARVHFEHTVSRSYPCVSFKEALSAPHEATSDAPNLNQWSAAYQLLLQELLGEVCNERLRCGVPLTLHLHPGYPAGISPLQGQILAASFGRIMLIPNLDRSSPKLLCRGCSCACTQANLGL